MHYNIPVLPACRPDKPSKEEKADMAQSIVTVFPVLKDASAGFVSIQFSCFICCDVLL